MRLASFVEGGQTRAGVVVADRIVPLDGPASGDLTWVVHRWPDFVGHLHETAMEARPGLALSDVRLTLPFRPRRILATGGNYSDHLREMSVAAPQAPSAFLKLPGCECGTGDPLVLRTWERHVDYEGELALVIGFPTREASPTKARDAVAGLMLANDISSRDVSMAHTVLAKGRKGFCPLGPMLVTADELDLDDVGFTVMVNGELRQSAHTSRMVHTFADIVASFSQAAPLLPGDVILTGTPAGVGVAHVPPRFLRAGDEVIVASPQLGELRTPVVGDGATMAGDGGAAVLQPDAA